MTIQYTQLRKFIEGSGANLAAIFLFALWILAATTFLPDLGGQGAVSQRGFITALLRAAAFGLVVIFVSPSRFIRAIFKPAILLLLMIGVYAMLSAAWSSDPVRALGKSGEFLLVIASAAALGQFAAEKRLDYAKLIFWGSLAAIITYLLLNLAYYGSPLAFRQIAGQDRVRLVFGYNHPLVAARILLFGIAGAWGILANPNINRPSKGFIAVAYASFLALIYLTNARVALGMATLLTAALFFILLQNPARRVTFLILLGGFILACFAILFIPAVNQALLSSVDLEELLSINGRVRIWTHEFTHLKKLPIYGYGYQAYDFFLTMKAEWATHSHNALLEMFFSFGVFGVIFYFALLVIYLPLVINIKQEPLLGILFLIIILDSMLSIGIIMPTQDAFVLAFIGSLGLSGKKDD